MLRNVNYMLAHARTHARTHLPIRSQRRYYFNSNKKQHSGNEKALSENKNGTIRN
jgi:hypothetical protein